MCLQQMPLPRAIVVRICRDEPLLSAVVFANPHHQYARISAIGSGDGTADDAFGAVRPGMSLTDLIQVGVNVEGVGQGGLPPKKWSALKVRVSAI